MINPLEKNSTTEEQRKYMLEAAEREEGPEAREALEEFFNFESDFMGFIAAMMKDDNS